MGERYRGRKNSKEIGEEKTGQSSKGSKKKNGSVVNKVGGKSEENGTVRGTPDTTHVRCSRGKKHRESNAVIKQ